MTIVIVVASIVCWWLSGVSGFVYWWTNEFDLDSDDFAAGCLIGFLLGPVAWIFGRMLHGRNKRPRVIMRRRA